MNFAVRDGKFDVVIAAGPRVENWPSAGVRAVSSLCADIGLTVAQYGGEDLTVRGVIPLPGTGGLVLVEDIQKRIHRIRARTVIRITPESDLPDPFPGWRSQGLIPISTAERLIRESRILWSPITVVLGSGNRALRFGSTLLESGVPQVIAVESYPQWGAKRFSGWEVERRRFEMNGGKLIEAKPLQLIAKAPLLWQLRLQDQHGIRVIDVGRVVSAGPFRNFPGVREHPPGSFLFELEQSSANTRSENIEGWVLEEERGKWLAGKIIKALVTDLGDRREAVDHIQRRARSRLKRYFKHREEPFTPAYQGKWVAVSDGRRLKTFSGVPQEEHRKRPIASVECFEEIPCNVCQTVCPTSAIQIGKVPRKLSILNENACTACGLCVSSCPSGIIPMLHEKEERSTSLLTLSWRGQKPWNVGEFATLLNRRGENLGSARVSSITDSASGSQRVQLEVPTHLLWEARAIRKGRQPVTEDEEYLASIERPFLHEEKVEISLNGEKRLVRDRIPISVALFEIGQGRPEDVLYCKDGSCGLCQLTVDGVKKLACQAKIHRGMSIRTDSLVSNPSTLCPCLDISRELIEERMKQGNLHSPEAVLSVTRVGEGKCHGQLCQGALKRLLADQGLDISQWIDWRFPWADWVLVHNS